MSQRNRSVAVVAKSYQAQPAPGLIVDRPLPGPEVDHVSPFLMLDHFGPLTVAPGDQGGLNPHPHRGFETVTLLFEGAMEHQDSAGNRGVLRPGDVQWMTAARGIVHAEYREYEFAQHGGTLHGVQLWVNLPARDKMNPPGYQDLSAGRIPDVTQGANAVRVIAGTFAATAGPARTHTPLLVLQLRLAEGEPLRVPVPKEWNVLAYLVEGDVAFADVSLEGRQMAVFAADGDGIELTAVTPSQVLVLAGEPIDEPVVSWGPFVMNTQEQILQARKDYALGRMGVLETGNWKLEIGDQS